jgi:hypothetical protein
MSIRPPHYEEDVAKTMTLSDGTFTLDRTTKSIRVHDGETIGGIKFINEDATKALTVYEVTPFANLDGLVGADLTGKSFYFTGDPGAPAEDLTAITFSDGSAIKWNAQNQSWAYYDASGVQKQIFVEGGNYWTQDAWSVPDGIVISSVSSDWENYGFTDNIIMYNTSGGVPATIPPSTAITMEMLYNGMESVQNQLDGHTANDLQMYDQMQDDYDFQMAQMQAQITALQNGTYAPPPDQTNPTYGTPVDITSSSNKPLLGTQKTYTAPSDGIIYGDCMVPILASLLTSAALPVVKVNGSNAYAPNAGVLEGLLGQYATMEETTVKSGDQITQSNMTHLYFAPAQ